MDEITGGGVSVFGEDVLLAIRYSAQLRANPFFLRSLRFASSSLTSSSSASPSFEGSIPSERERERERESVCVIA